MARARVDAKTSCFFRLKKGWWDFDYYLPKAKFTKYDDDGETITVAFEREFIAVQWKAMWDDLCRFLTPSSHALIWKTAAMLLLLVAGASSAGARRELANAPLLAGFAVAFDAFTGGTQTTTTSKTLAHTASGSASYIVANPILHVINTDVISGVTWNSNAMASVVEYAQTGGSLGNKRIEFWGYANGTASGTSLNCTATLTNNSVSLDVISFTGAAQASTPASATYQSLSSSANMIPAVTVITANSMLCSSLALFTGSGYSGSTNTTVAGQPEGSRIIGYSTAVVATGSRQLSFAHSGTDDAAGVIIAIAPGGTAFQQNSTETLTMTDTLRKTTAKRRSETLTMTDTFLGRRVFLKALTETITLLDTLRKISTKTLEETITLTDTLRKRGTRTMEEAFTVVDTFVRVQSKGLQEVLTLTDTLTKSLNGFAITLWVKVSKPVNDLWQKITKPNL